MCSSSVCGLLSVPTVSTLFMVLALSAVFVVVVCCVVCVGVTFWLMCWGMLSGVGLVLVACWFVCWVVCACVCFSVLCCLMSSSRIIAAMRYAMMIMGLMSRATHTSRIRARFASKWCLFE